MKPKQDKDLKKLKDRVTEFKARFVKKNQDMSDKLNRLTPFKVLVDIISGIAVGGFLGYILDVYLGTLPFMLFLLTVFGMVGGVYNIYKDLDIQEKKAERKDA
jgi:F0F1-type ATP synthase assembly protein I